jgi:hypothetical protein
MMHRPLLALVLAAGITLAGCANDSDASAGGDADQPVSSSPQPSQSGDTGPDQGQPQVVKPRAGMADVKPIRWERSEPAKDGKSVRVFFTSGVAPCHVLDHIDVAYTDRVTVTLYEGSDAKSKNQVCIELAQLKAVDVPLDQPLDERKVVDGAAG